MAPLPPNNTRRVWLTYTSTGRQHELMFRISNVLNIADLELQCNEIATVCANRMLQTDSFIGARYSNQLSDFSIPLDFTPVPGVVSGANTTWENDPESAMLSLPFRDNSTGRDGRWCLFTPVRTVVWPLNNRYEPGESGPIDTWRTNMTAIANGGGVSVSPLITIGGVEARPKAYVNISHNAYWQRKQRRGG